MQLHCATPVPFETLYIIKLPLHFHFIETENQGGEIEQVMFQQLETRLLQTLLVRGEGKGSNTQPGGLGL